MAATESVMLELGVSAPSFSLQDVVSKKITTLQDFATKDVLVVAFICNHCPYVIRIHDAFVKMAAEYTAKNVAVVAINSNDIINYPDDSPEKMQDKAIEHSYTFPYLFDETQDVAKSYKAACTPDFFVFDKNRQLAYRGQFDDSRPKNDVPATGKDLIEAIDALLASKDVPQNQKPSIGCNIKWKQ